MVPLVAAAVAGSLSAASLVVPALAQTVRAQTVLAQTVLAQTTTAPATPAAASPASAQADVGELLFEAKHFKNTAPDAKIRYTFRREAADPAKLMPSFSDEIDFRLEPGSTPDNRNVIVTLFKGENHRPAGPFDDVSFNPIAILTLEFDVGNLSKLLHANPRYLKNAMRKAMRENPTITPIKIKLAGKDVDATQILIKPFADDRDNRDRLGPFLNTTYTFVISDAVPGSIYSIKIDTPDTSKPDAKPVLLEELKYAEN